MSFTYDEAESASDSDDYISAVRAIIQDVDSATAEISDERITALYGQTDEDDEQEVRNLTVALVAAQDLERKYRKQATYSSGGTSVQLGARADAWSKVVSDVALQLHAAAMKASGASGGVLYASRGPSYYSDVTTSLLA